MYDHIYGEIKSINPTSIVVRTEGGVGYLIKISLNAYSYLKQFTSAQILTHLVVREDAQALYGFGDSREREIFLMLIGVTGVGPNTALTILSYMTIFEVERAAANEDKSAFKAVKGIGEKLAAQIVLDLKGKFAVDMPSVPIGPLLISSTKKYEAVSAIMALGFNKTVATKAVDAAITSGETELEAIIKHSLKNIK